MAERREAGSVRDAILIYMQHEGRPLSVAQIHKAVSASLGGDVAASSIRSYLAENVPRLFRRVARGQYALVERRRVPSRSRSVNNTVGR